MKIRIRHTDIHISAFFIAVIPLVVISGSYAQFILAYISIILHELAHMATAAIYGCRTVSLRVLPVGLSADIDTENCRRKEKLAIYSSGPAVSFFLSAAAYLAYILLSENLQYLYFISLLNFCLAVFNLIPALPLDGGKILQEILNDSIGLITAAKYIRAIALLLCIIATGAGVYQILAGNLNFSLFIMGLYFIVFFNTGKMEASLMNIKQLLYRRQRLLNKGIYQARDLVVLKGMRLGAVIKALDYDRFHFIYLLDEDLKLLRIITENEIIDCMLKHPGDMTFEELLKLLEA
ncbi:MAG: hypothetical protein A2Y21_06405 [Clostridiales bacterium GWC2_40_7]|nr:MAG: hypothetical protein A2Y21_06405 [Clostridiales bacterium GWC2_40_7]